MVKTRLSLVVILLFSGLLLQAQDCKLYFPDAKGTTIETRSYDAKEKLTGSVKQVITDKQVDGDNVTISMAHESFDKKGVLIMDGTYEVRCIDGIFYLDMRNMLDEASLSAYENMEVEVNANDMAFPAQMEVGQSLPDADIIVKVNSGSTTIFTMRVTISNRKVEALEDITTPAGTYSCYKTSYDVDSKMIVSIKASAIQWIAEDFGVVRSESYNKKGKLQGYSVIHKIDRP